MAEIEIIQAVLEFPPSVNHYYKRFKTGVALTDKAKSWRELAVIQLRAAMVGTPVIEGRVALYVDMSMPDEKQRDLDNYLKATLDALQHGGIYVDDSQIDFLSVLRIPPKNKGQVVVRVCLLD